MEKRLTLVAQDVRQAAGGYERVQDLEQLGAVEAAAAPRPENELADVARASDAHVGPASSRSTASSVSSSIRLTTSGSDDGTRLSASRRDGANAVSRPGAPGRTETRAAPGYGRPSGLTADQIRTGCR